MHNKEISGVIRQKIGFIYHLIGNIRTELKNIEELAERIDEEQPVEWLTPIDMQNPYANMEKDMEEDS